MTRGDAVVDQLRHLVGQGPHQAEAVYHAAARGLTRYAGSRIHQNLDRQESTVTFRVALEDRIGVARTNDLTLIGMEACLDRALAVARLQKPSRWWPGLPAGGGPPAGVTGWDAPEPAWRLEQAHTILREVGRAGLQAAGSVATGSGELAVVNSEGRLTREPYRVSDAVLVAMDGDGNDGASGYATWAGHEPGDLDPSALGAVATEKCLLGRQRAGFEPGPVDVLLEPPAVAGLLDWLGYIGFGGKNDNDGTSFLSRRMGERIMGANVTIYDDHAEIPGMGLSRDFEGERRQRVDLVRDGLAAGVVHDRLTAARAGVETTGHALSADTELGPMPLNMAMAPGTADQGEMIARLDRGLVVTRFHYLNGLLDTRRALFTGMTRDGTFLVEGGRIVGAVDNLRFTESMLDAFSRIESISRQRQSIGTWTGRGATCTVPAILIRDFHFDPAG